MFPSRDITANGTFNWRFCVRGAGYAESLLL